VRVFQEVRWAAGVGLLLTLGAGTVAGQEPVDLEVVTKIREEGFQRSRVMDLVSYMTDVLGPRLTGSPNMRRAQRWAKATLDSMGLANSVIEPFGEAGVGWANSYTSLHLTAPDYQPLIGYPFAFTVGTNGKLAREAVLAVIRSADDFDRFRGKLRGAIVLAAPPKETALGWHSDAERLSEDSLRYMASVASSSRFSLDGQAHEWSDQAKAFVPVGTQLSAGGFQLEVLRFFKQEGVGVVLYPGEGRDGTVFVAGRPGSREDRSYAGVMSAPPMVALAAEHYNRIYRILARGIPARLEVEVRNTVDTSDTKGYNVLADWPGTDLADQLVMVGGHYDSWHAGTGATDDAAGVAAAIEAIRILRAIGVRPRRTIRVALWSFEEGGKVGSRAYVAKHADELRAKLSGYFNLDNGGGRVRGVYLQGNEYVRPIFRRWMMPFTDLGVGTLTINDAYGVDVVGFDLAGLPGFQFIQDPLDYDTRTHHSNMDVYDKLQPDDLRRNAVVLASFLYHAAMRNEPLPREHWPAR